MTKKLVLLLFCVAFGGGLTGCEIAARQFKGYDCRAAAVPDPKTSEDFVLASRYHTDFGEYECAYTAAEAALRLKKDNPEAYNARALAHYGFQEYSAALADFQMSVRLDAKNPKTFYGRSAVYEKLGDPENALKDLDTVIALGQNDSRYRAQFPVWINQRGFLRMEKGDTAGALADFSQAITLAPDNSFYYDDRARLYRQIGETAAAEEDERRAATLKTADEQKKSAAQNN